ncbi:MAG: hypothetical protein JWQ02_734 [Capsulimonas sp.]|nr:hypothetical protein [Capsulimonas sp.]
MKTITSIAVRRALFSAAVLALVTPLVTGCGADRPNYGQANRDNGYSEDVTSPTLVAEDINSSPGVKSSSPLINEQDPLVQAAGNPLANGAPDLKADTSGPSEDNPALDVKPIDDDPFLRQDISTGTAHSHWLRGTIVNANVEVRLNSARVADFFSNTDKDISRNCRKGLNTVTFIYKPRGTDSSAKLSVLESEHDPPIAPLATFNSLDDAGGVTTRSSAYSSDNSPKPLMRSFTFMAQ